MNDMSMPDRYGRLTEPTTLQIERLLPGPIERVWSYLIDSDLRRQWLASGTMEEKAGSAFELTWRNDELSRQPSQRPDGFGKEHSMKGKVLVCEPPHRLSHTWGENGSVTFDLKTVGRSVHLTLTHRRLDERGTRLMVGAGWHAHLDVLADRLDQREPGPFWDRWTALRAEYDARLPQ
jgi:uncharacterized protein YndB with AHSA1/START domain